ncbi:hypothetical protein FAVG1_00522 [Fusarium avenaceum]|nr:hypothetical protein FAVG1_00522 [Fusarium avenaceum]
MDQATPTQMAKHHWSNEVISQFPKAVDLTVAQFELHIDGIADDRRRDWTRENVARVVSKYNELRTGPVPDTCKSYTYKFLTENTDTWIPKSYPITDHPFTPQIRNGKTASFPKWLVICSIWPGFTVTACLSLKMTDWWGVAVYSSMSSYPPASHYSVEEYERLFEGGEMEKIRSKNGLFMAHTQQKSGVEVQPGNPTLEKTSDTPSSGPAARNEVTGHPNMPSNLIHATYEPIDKDPAPLTETNNFNSAANTEAIDLSEHRDPPGFQAAVYHERRVKDLEKQLEKAKADQQHAQRIAWHNDQAKHHMQQYEHHTRKINEHAAALQDQERPQKKQRKV